MQKQEPFGYEAAHPEKEFRIKTVEKNLILQCEVKHDRKKQIVSYKTYDKCNVCDDLDHLHLYSLARSNFSRTDGRQ